MSVMTQSLGSETVSIPTLGEILRADPHAFVEKYDDIAAINLACAAGLPRGETLDIAKSLKALDAMAMWIQQRTERSWSIYERDPTFFDGSQNLLRIILMMRFLHVQFGVRYNPRRMAKCSTKRQRRRRYSNLLGCREREFQSHSVCSVGGRSKKIQIHASDLDWMANPSLAQYTMIPDHKRARDESTTAQA
jgi:hypothetical protein